LSYCEGNEVSDTVEVVREALTVAWSVTLGNDSLLTATSAGAFVSVAFSSQMMGCPELVSDIQV
jgi:hypothetical protein